ncbi:MAG: hypothetical protein LC118_10420 [Dehalococcoidia bacterium]|nr:hypothetical protein [Dehalococcoidia bacterium]
MTNATTPEATVRYEGPGVSTEIWAMTQANFMVMIPGQHAKEAAIALNDAAAKYLAEQLGQEDTPENRQALARDVGSFILTKQLGAGGRIDSVTTVSVALLGQHPELVDHLKSIEG